MNLAVHGLEGNIQKAITYYEDPHELLGKADFVMANPPFNVDEVDADKIKRDPRLSFGLPGVNKEGKVSNGNYLWISYFYSYLNETGRAGFVMSSQASSASRDEAKVRQALIEAGAVDIMIAVRSNFFYTRTVPCELWFLNRAKPEQHEGKVLMVDARNIYRKVTRKIYDFSPEQLQNLLSIVWLYRGEGDRYCALVASYLKQTLAEASACFTKKDRDGREIRPLDDYLATLSSVQETVLPFLDTLSPDAAHAEVLGQLKTGMVTFLQDLSALRHQSETEAEKWEDQRHTTELNETTGRLNALVEFTRNLTKQSDSLYKVAGSLIDVSESELAAKESDLWVNREVAKARKAVDSTRQVAVNQLKQVRYYHKQAVWLTERFPDGELRDVEGLVKLVDKNELESNDWSLTPGRYIGLALEDEDGGGDFEETLREMHIELESLNAEAVKLAAKIKKSFEGLGI